MGCGASKDPKIGVADSTKPIQNPNNKNNYSNNKSNQRNGFKQVELKNASQNDPSNLNSKREPTKAPLAFVISFDENNKTGAPTRPPPGRLRLEPLKHTQTKAEIDDKIRNAELKRERILADRAKSSNGKKLSQLQRSNNYNDNRYDSDSMNRNDIDARSNYNQRKGSDERERDSENRQRLLNRRRIVQNPDPEDDEIEHDKNYNNRDSDGYHRRY